MRYNKSGPDINILVYFEFRNSSCTYVTCNKAIDCRMQFRINVSRINGKVIRDVQKEIK